METRKTGLARSLRKFRSDGEIKGNDMAVIVKAGGAFEMWTQELRARLPDVELREWESPGDPASVEVAVVFKPEPGSLRRFPNLKAILSTGAGVDGIMTDPDLPPGVPIARLNDPWMSMRLVQYAAHWVLRLHRRFEVYENQQRRRQWRPLDEPEPDGAAPRVGILGYGVIGRMTGDALLKLGYRVAGWTRSLGEHGLVETFWGEAMLVPFLERSDFLICLLPLTDATRGILNARTLAALPEGASLINMGRGGHVVEADLLAALDFGRLARAVLDVFPEEPLPPEHPFWSHPRVVVTPHVAGITNPLTAADQIAANIRRALAGEPLENVVDVGRGY